MKDLYFGYYRLIALFDSSNYLHVKVICNIFHRLVNVIIGSMVHLTAKEAFSMGEKHYVKDRRHGRDLSNLICIIVSDLR